MMVVNNQEPDSGGKEGVLAVIAIAVVLFFVIRIYADYVTKTGQAVKPPDRHVERSQTSSTYRSIPDDPLYGADSSGGLGANSAGDPTYNRPRKPSISDDEVPSDTPPTRRPRAANADENIPSDVYHRSPKPRRADNGFGRYPDYQEPRRASRPRIATNSVLREHRAMPPYAGEIVIEHAPDSPYIRDSGRRRSLGTATALNTPRAHRSRSPYPGQIVIEHAPSSDVDDRARRRDQFPGQIVMEHAPGPAAEGPERQHRRFPGQIVMEHAPYPPTEGAAREHRRFPGQIVMEHARGMATETAFGRTIGQKHRSDLVQRAGHIDDGGPLDTVATSGENAPNSTRTAMFRGLQPYPSEFDDVQVGDRLSELVDADLPRGRYAHAMYTYNPEDGPFKTISAKLASGRSDPFVTGVVYRFRDSKCRAQVRRRALEAFGEGEVIVTEDGERRRWSHINGCTITLERDRYCVDREMAGVTEHASRSFGRTIAE